MAAIPHIYAERCRAGTKSSLCRVVCVATNVAAMSDGLPTPRCTLRTGYVCVHVWCKACRHVADADLKALIAAGRGDLPLKDLRFRCTSCRSGMTDFVVLSKDSAVVP